MRLIAYTDEGLEKTGATMSQIPTYVTAVPNGTEKVSSSQLASTWRISN